MARAPRTTKAAEASESIVPVINPDAPNTAPVPVDETAEGKGGPISDATSIAALVVNPAGAGEITETGKASGEVPAASPDAGTAQALIAAAQVAREAPPAPDEPELIVYPVRSPLRHNRLRYSPDDPRARTIPLTEAEAETLIAIGVLGEP